MGSCRAKDNWHLNACPEALFPCCWCQWAICINVGTDCSCQDKYQHGPPYPNLWSRVYYTRLWKSLASCLLYSGTVEVLGKVWFPDRKIKKKTKKKTFRDWDRFSRLVGGFFPDVLCQLVGAARRHSHFLITLKKNKKTIRTFNHLFCKLWETADLTS